MIQARGLFQPKSYPFAAFPLLIRVPFAFVPSNTLKLLLIRVTAHINGTSSVLIESAYQRKKEAFIGLRFHMVPYKNTGRIMGRNNEVIIAAIPIAAPETAPCNSPSLAASAVPIP